jgi:signal transduction histidine kinase
MMPLQKIRTSFSAQLSLWVAGFVLVISAVVIILLVRFSEDVIRDETIDTTLQALENTALKIDNTLRQQEITARLENQRMRVNRSRIERLIEENGSEELLRKSLPNAQLFVTRRDSVGRLTNSFVSMQQSLAKSVADIQRVNDELQQQNDELTAAYQLKLDTNRKKTLFIRDMYHEIRTPLNIINGFTQVLSGMFHEIPGDELTDITARMRSSAEAISHLTRMLEASVSTSTQPTARTSSSHKKNKE